MLNDGEGGWCPLIGMVKIHQSDSCLKAQVAQGLGWINGAKLKRLSYTRFLGAITLFSRFYTLP